MLKSQRLSLNTLFWITGGVSLWLCVTMPVFSQEAYYWTYAQHPDLAYFDHPPMMAWLIWLGTAVLGDGALGIRLGTWLCGIGTAWLGMRLLLAMDAGPIAGRIWILLSVGIPALAVVRVLANPDPPLTFFMTLSTYAIYCARSGSGRWWLLAGAAAGAGLLSKYTAAFLLGSGLLLLVFDPDYRRQLRGPWIYLGVVMAAVVFSPVVIWNFGNDFESFRFQTAERFEQAEVQFGRMAELVGGQFGLLNPLVAMLVPAALLWHLRRMRVESHSLFLLAFALPLPLYMLMQSLWIQIKVNWLVPAYVPLMLAVAIWWAKSQFAIRHPRFSHVMVGTLVWMQVCSLAGPLVRLVPAGRGSSWSGWQEVAALADRWQHKLDAEDGKVGNAFFFAPDYRDSAQLGRSLLLLWQDQDAQEQVRCDGARRPPTLAQNVFGRPALQYDHWVQPETLLGQDAVLVLPRPDHRQGILAEVEPRFERMKKVETLSIETLGIRLLEVDIYVCRGYRGPEDRS